MKTSTIITRVLAPAMAAALTTACDHKELCFDHPHGAEVEVVFDWDRAPQAAPDGMTVYFYDLEDPQARPLRFDFAGRDGGTCRLPMSSYEAICVNADNEWARFTDTHSLATFRAVTRQADLLEGMNARSETTPYAPGTSHQPCVVYPDDIFADTVPLTEIEDLETRYVVTFHPEDVLCHYTYEIRNITNLRSVRSFSGTLSGMSPELLLASRSHPGAHSIIPFGGNGDGPNRITGAFNVFGHLPGDPGRAKAKAGDGGDHEDHHMMLYAVLRDGSGFSKPVDVTAQVHDAPDPRNVHIVIDGLEFPEVEGDGDFDISVNSWVEEIVEIPM